MGRKSKDALEKHICRVQVMLKLEELVRLQEAAKDAKMTLSNFCRSKLI